MMKMRPFALMLPAMLEVAPATRFSVIALADGCWNATVSPAATSKFCRLMIARALFCFTTVVVPCGVIEA